MAAKRTSLLPRPSRWVLNAGILSGATVGFILQGQSNADNYESFLITAISAMLGAGLFIYIEYFMRLRANKAKNSSPQSSKR